LPYIDNNYEKSWNEYYALNYDKKNYDFYYDVGWLVRKKLEEKICVFSKIRHN